MTLWQNIQKKVGVAADGVPDDATARAVAKALGIGHELAEPSAFFALARKLTGSLDQTQVDVVNALLDKAVLWSVGWLAYGLATAWHEAKLRPCEEIGKGKGHPYGAVNATGKAPYGRGLVQLTWDSNYRRADDELGLHGALAANYDRALEPDIAVAVLVHGMEEGWFTGKGLGDYIRSDVGTHAEFLAARRIINGTDRAELISGYADQFKAALIAGGWS